MTTLALTVLLVLAIAYIVRGATSQRPPQTKPTLPPGANVIRMVPLKRRGEP